MKVAYKKNRAKLMFFSHSIIIQPIPLHFHPVCQVSPAPLRQAVRHATAVPCFYY